MVAMVLTGGLNPSAEILSTSYVKAIAKDLWSGKEGGG